VIDALYRLEFPGGAIGLPIEQSCVKRGGRVWVPQTVYEHLRKMKAARRGNSQLRYVPFRVVQIRCLKCGMLLDGGNGWGIHAQTHRSYERRTA
jgi:hypothetical protein